VLDLRIINGLVVDGMGGEPFPGGVGIRNGRIAVVGRSELPEAARTLDAQGGVIAPGFIDMHSHSDLRLLVGDPPTAKVAQGITTEVLGQDGLGVAPVTAQTAPVLAGLTPGLLGPLPLERWTWRSFADYLAELERADLPNNQLVLVSHGALRLLTVGPTDRPATPQELAEMQALLREALAAGAPGFSTGLIYPPAAYAPTEELLALTRVVAAHDGVFVVHLRDEGYRLLTALQEALTVCREAGCRLHISHLKAHGRASWHLLPRALEMLAAARASGLTITCDRYPYLAGSTVLSSVLPHWVLDGGPAACLHRLRNPAERSRIRQWFTYGPEVWNNQALGIGWENIVVSSVASHRNRWVQGLSVAEIAAERGVDPVDAVCDLLAEEELSVTMISHYGCEENLEAIYRLPYATVGSDGIFGGQPHPRLWGSYPRFFGRYVRDRGLLTLAEAVRRVSALPAEVLRLRDRGILAAGMAADIVVFDPARIRDRATYDAPEQPPAGISAVVVNGRLVWDGRRLVWNNGLLPGQVLRVHRL